MAPRILTAQEQKPLLQFQDFCMQNFRSRPLIAAALSPEFEEPYRLISQYGFAELIEPLQGHVYYQYYCLSLLVYWVRKFYEDSNGMEAYHMLGVSQATWSLFLNACRTSQKCRPWVNEKMKFPRSGQKTREWLRRQCWLLKANKRGRTATRLQNNASVYNCLQETFFADPAMSWEHLFAAGEEVGGRLRELELLAPFFPEQKIPAAIQDVFDSYRAELLLSIKAMGSEEYEKTDALPPAWRWLESVWGIGKYEMLRESKRMPYLRAVWKLELNGDILNLYVQVTCAEEMSVSLKQGDVTLRSGLQDGNKCLVRDLPGFDSRLPLMVCGSSPGAASPVSQQLRFCPGDWMLFRATEAALTQTNQWEYETHDTYVRPAHSFWLIHRMGESVSASLDGKDCATPGFPRPLFGDWVGHRFSFPERLEHPNGADFIVNGRFVSRFVERPRIRIVESGVPEEVEIDETDIPGVGAGHRLAAGVLRFEGSGSFERDGQFAGEGGPYPDDHQWLIPLGEKSLHRPGVCFFHKRGGKVVWKRDIFVLREDWQDHLEPDSPERRRAAYKYQKKEALLYVISETGEKVHLLKPAEKPFFCWCPRGGRKDNQPAEVCLRLNDIQSFKSYQLNLFLPSAGSFVELSVEVDGKKKWSRSLSSAGFQNTKIKKALKEVLAVSRGTAISVRMDHREILAFDATAENCQQLM